MLIFKKYFCIKQHDIKDCGVACLATIAKEYGFNIPISKIRELAGTDNQGTTMYGMIRAAENLNFKTKAVRLNNKNDISKNIPKPFVAHVVINESFLHYVVVHEIKKGIVTVADPAIGIVRYKIEEFFKIWDGVILMLYPNSNFETGDKTKGMSSKFLNTIISQKSLFVNVILASILVTLLGMGGSFYFKFLLDDILPNNLSNSLFVISLAIVGLAIFKVITEFFRSMILLHLSQNIDIKICLGYFTHVIDLPVNFFETRKVGEVLSRFNDAGNIREALSTVTLTVLIDSVMAIFGAVILYCQSPTLFFMCFIPIVAYMILVIAFKKVLENGNRQYMEENSVLTSYLVEALQGIETIKAFNGERSVKEETEKRYVKYIKSIFKYGYTNNLQISLKSTVQSIFSILILWVGAELVIKGNISIGGLISFNSLLAYFIGPIERLINLQSQVQTAIVAGERLGEILELEKEKDKNEEGKVEPKTLLSNIQFKDVSFRYGGRKEVLKQINIEINPGEKIAFVGESGSGKTTIAKLLMNFYDIEKGDILIDYKNIKDINKEVLRDKMAYISQSAFFFSGSIKENLKFSNQSATYEDIIEACEFAHMHEYINSLPLRYDTILEENASNLSGGQRQRLAIARALLRKPEILILDEATSNLDSITEKAIEKTIEEHTNNVTTLIIAHRLSTIMKCDRIYVLEKGQIIEQGNHFELIAKNGYYYKLWRQQAPKKYSDLEAS